MPVDWRNGIAFIGGKLVSVITAVPLTRMQYVPQLRAKLNTSGCQRRTEGTCLFHKVFSLLCDSAIFWADRLYSVKEWANGLILGQCRPRVYLPRPSPARPHHNLGVIK